MTAISNRDTLRSHLSYEPQELRFGTSGRRGELVHLTQLEIYINTLAELEYLLSLPPSEGGIVRGGDFYFAFDLRPSSARFVPEHAGRGEIAQAVEQAIRDAGMRPVNLGPIPTPALTCFALARGAGSIMVTGSHIPFDWNGYKTNTSLGELRKQDEGPVNDRVRRIRQHLYDARYSNSPFDGNGRFKAGHRDLAPETPAARTEYIARYADFFGAGALKGMPVLVYQHSAVGRDILVETLERLGAIVIPGGRSDEFIPIDTENIEDSLLASIQVIADMARAKFGPLCAVVSTDGDSDRPMVLGVEPETGKVTFYGGDLVGMLVAEYLGADAVVVPISCNDAIDRGPLRDRVAPRTRIGSPYVTAGMDKARSKGARVVCGWEANGGFILGSDLDRKGRRLRALPTRDAVLPILGVLMYACERKLSVTGLFARLPRRFSRATLLKRFPRPLGRKIVERYSPMNKEARDVVFESGTTVALDEDGRQLAIPDVEEFESLRRRLEVFFSPAAGFRKIIRLNYTDGVRITFAGGDIAHFRPSGNADELRIYALADTAERAEEIARTGVADPNGILRRMEEEVAGTG